MKKKKWKSLIRDTNTYAPERYCYNKKGELCIKRASLADCGYFYWVIPKEFKNLALKKGK